MKGFLTLHSSIHFHNKKEKYETTQIKTSKRDNTTEYCDDLQVYAKGYTFPKQI